ncbi:hypothetical protein LARI1_G006890 [Lachnellula arida]|uniref:LCCL domain-containing protein n=1 Tax=Lachnellula arida TaxID=1316785 RepID=A0A8T9B3E5_9HELO|nr:hypothetical protein LARI1_G006890 [Lachnellula arida]
MAAPAEISIKDLSGAWVMNKTLSDDTDPVLALQGVGWWTRKAIGLATVTLHTKQYTGDDSTTHIDISQTVTGGIQGTTENRVLNWQEREHEDHIFGHLKGRSRWLSSSDYDSEITDPFLKAEWLDVDSEKGGPSGEIHIESSVVNEEKGWTAQQVWGFAVVDGQRYYVRRVLVTKGKDVLRVRLVYNWQGKE